MKIDIVRDISMGNSTKYMSLQSNPEIEIEQRDEGMDRIFFVRDNEIGRRYSQYKKRSSSYSTRLTKRA
ncbi:MAG: hypothetical protein ABR985_14065, partial [Methanotrichaceae archaeon]